MIAVIDYQAGNIQSVLFALQRLGADPILTADAAVIRRADAVLFPGQGEAASAMQSLRATGLDTLIPQLTQPFFGICVGMQLLCSHSEEGDTTCLSIMPQRVRRFQDPSVKVPHVGWNTLEHIYADTPQTILSADFEGKYVYFVHSYFVELGEFTTATCQYGDTHFAAMLQRDNFYAAQFHAEKSSTVGEQLIKNFLDKALM